jgi:hypothetical protein
MSRGREDWVMQHMGFSNWDLGVAILTSTRTLRSPVDPVDQHRIINFLESAITQLFWSLIVNPGKFQEYYFLKLARVSLLVWEIVFQNHCLQAGC